ncbi:MAG: DNA methylase [candidate division Zixibacteria bacterium HGW-Zixibacteria-1]|nr:MAG: DNA methylase [candidate division Zixibacteria bacterium HGW-Zixibacteria-1]
MNVFQLDKYLDCDLQDLNLNWKEKELPQTVRTKHVHKLHPYFGKFIPQLAEIFLRRFFSKGETVADPFMGSGTTLVEANLLDMNSIGIDVSEFNCIISKAKTRNYNIDKLRNEVFGILDRTRNFFLPDALFKEKIPAESLQTNSKYLNKWYLEKPLKEILAYKYFLNDYEYKETLMLIMSRAARSARNIPHYELDHPKDPVSGPYWCKKHSRMCYPVSEGLKFLEQYSKDTVRRIEEFSAVRKNTAIKIIHSDSRQVKYGEEISGVLTSPPYVGNIDYHRQHEYAYELFGIINNEDKEIGPMYRGRSKLAVKSYISDISEVLINLKKYLKENSPIIIVANDSLNIYPEIFNTASIKMKHVVNRQVDRRTGRRNLNYSESVFICES